MSPRALADPFLALSDAGSGGALSWCHRTRRWRPTCGWRDMAVPAAPAYCWARTGPPGAGGVADGLWG